MVRNVVRPAMDSARALVPCSARPKYRSSNDGPLCEASVFVMSYRSPKSISVDRRLNGEARRAVVGKFLPNPNLSTNAVLRSRNRQAQAKMTASSPCGGLSRLSMPHPMHSGDDLANDRDALLSIVSGGASDGIRSGIHRPASIRLHDHIPY